MVTKQQSILLVFGALIGALLVAVLYLMRSQSDVVQVKAGAPGRLDQFEQRKLEALQRELTHRFDQYRKNGSWRRRLALDEIITVYLRAYPFEALDSLRSLNALCLVSPREIEQILPHPSLDNFREVLEAASQNPRWGDPLIIEAFRRKMASDPREAFKLLDFLPSYLDARLSKELAREWGRQDGPAAARAFMEERPNREWTTGVNDVLLGWAEKDPTAAFQFIRNLDESRSTEVHNFLLPMFLSGLSNQRPLDALKFIPDDAYPNPVYLRAARADEAAALQRANEIQSPYARILALEDIIGGVSDRNPSEALHIASQMPASENSLGMIRWSAARVAGTAADANELLDKFDNPYQRKAVMSGITEGMYKKDGASGVANITQRGVDTQNPEWIESAGSLILKSKATEANARNWKALPPETIATLIQHAENRWPAEKIALLKERLKQ